MTREEWLNRVAESMAPWFEEMGYPLPRVRCSIGFPSKGKRSKAIGECWAAKNSADGHHEILIRPDRSDSLEVAAILAHELTHAAIGVDHGHNTVFKSAMVSLGLEGKATATTAGPLFVALVTPILEAIGPLPHGALDWSQATTATKRQTTRLIKAECPECGYPVRITRKWLDEIGSPHCPKHGAMTAEPADEQPEGAA